MTVKINIAHTNASCQKNNKEYQRNILNFGSRELCYCRNDEIGRMEHTTRGHCGQSTTYAQSESQLSSQCKMSW
jgi:hypothetical protein|eukprot:COSAG02_NODE_2561_length_8528_cov_8.976391_3_plen_74_part_00